MTELTDKQRMLIRRAIDILLDSAFYSDEALTVRFLLGAYDEAKLRLDRAGISGWCYICDLPEFIDEYRTHLCTSLPRALDDMSGQAQEIERLKSLLRDAPLREDIVSRDEEIEQLIAKNRDNVLSYSQQVADLKAREEKLQDALTQIAGIAYEPISEAARSTADGQRAEPIAIVRRAREEML